MSSDNKQAIFLVLIAISTVSALVINIGLAEIPINQLSYFTIQSNIIVAFYTISTLIYMLTRTNRPSFWHQLGGFSTLSITITAVVYNILLSDWSKFFTPDGFANLELHVIAPLLMLIYFLCVAPKIIIPYKVLFYWIAYPFLYFIGALIRGSRNHWYPYWFLDLSSIGLPKLSLIWLTLLVGFFALGFILIFINNRLKKN